MDESMGVQHGYTIKVLQQWWSETKINITSMQPVEIIGEWRDVPLGNEK
jgi:hypothetical protein